MTTDTMQGTKTYWIQHKRKGEFVGMVCAFDKEFVTVDINTAEGSGQEHLANTVTYINGKKTSSPLTRKRLRLALITQIEEVKGVTSNGS